MKIYAISGGPGVGKTSVINELKKLGFFVLEEAARIVRENDKRFIGKSILEINKKEFQDEIYEYQQNQFSKIYNIKNEIVSDRGLGDTLAYYKLAGLEIHIDQLEYAKNFRYNKVFLLDFLNDYEKDDLRQESKEEQVRIQETIYYMYLELSYIVIKVPNMALTERVDFIKNIIRR